MIINLKTMPSRKWVSSGFTVTILFVLFIIFTLAPSLNGLSSVDERGGRKLFGGYRITPKFCRATKSLPRTDPRSRGPTICMFNHECAQRQGEVVGACMDGFLFGACCQIPGDIDTTLIQQAQQTPTLTSNFGAAQSYESYGSNVQNNDVGYLPYPTKQPVHSESSLNSGSGYYGSNEGDLESEADIDSNYNSNGDNAVESSYENNSGSVGPTSAGSNFDDEVSSYLPDSTVLPSPTQGQMYLPINFSSELPMLITSSPYDESYETFSGSSSERVPVVGSIITSNGIHHISNTIIHEQPINFNNGPNEEFTQSGITHPSADSVLLDEDLQFSTGYGPSTVYVPAPTQISSSTTASTFAKPTYQKPAFRPKPTAPSTSSTHTGSGTTSDEKYVLVQTITNDDKRPGSASGMTTNDIESIESIILMLNDTKHGSHYDSTASPLVSASTETYKPSYNSPFIPIKPTARPSSTTNVVNKENFSSTNYFVSTTLAPPTRFSTRYPTQPSYLYSSSQVPSSTLRPPFTPITSTKRKPSPTTVSTTPKPTTVTVTKKVTTVTTLGTPSSSVATTPVKRQPPSTSYVTGPPTRRPVTIGSLGGSSSTIYLNDIKVPSTTPSSLFSSSYGTSQGIPSSTQKVDIEHVVQSKPISQEPTYIKIPATQRPDPTVIITPKPTVNLVTSSTWTQRPPSGSSTYTTPAPPALPSTSYIFNPIVTQRPGYVSSTPEYINLPALVSNDFDDPGYYGQPSSQGPAYDKLATLAPGDVRPSYPGYYGPTPSYIGGSAPTPSVLADHVEEEIYTSPNDFVNFPPVRNPNLNTSATTGTVTSDFDVSTPAFVEDEILRDKMNLLVSKIVASLQNNFDNLAEVVDERNATVEVLSTVPPTRRPTSSPAATRKPSSGKPASGKPASGKPSSGKPSSGKPSSGKPSSGKPSPSKPPTTIQQDASRPTTVSRPSSQTTAARPTQTSSRPSSSATKPSSGNRRPTTTKPPVKRPATKPSSTPPKRTTPKPTVIRRPTTKPTKRIATTTVQQDETEEEGSETDEEEDNTIPAEEIGENIEDSEEGSRKIQCGVRPLIKSGRIVGGKGARFGEWPWQVLVRESTWLGLFTKNKCGGVLITNRFVITAAHCQPGFLASLVAVFGEFDISGDLEVKRSVTKNVKEVIVHRQYDAATFENDLALLKLESPVHYDTHIVPICMPPDSSEFTGRMATVTGWGRLRYGGGVPSILQVVQVPVIENSVCQEMFNTAKHKKKILPSFLCAGYANGQKDSCEGDSGGPLVMQRDDGRWQLVGTVSHGVKCADPYLPGVYMRTTYYKPWLKSVTGVK